MTAGLQETRRHELDLVDPHLDDKLGPEMRPDPREEHRVEFCRRLARKRAQRGAGRHQRRPAGAATIAPFKETILASSYSSVSR